MYNDQQELLIKAKAGNKEAKEIFLNKNRGLVIHIARRFSEIDNEDLIQAGFIGMLKALDKFDFQFGTAFSTYAVPFIMGEIKEWLRKEKQVNLGRKGRALYLRFREESERIFKEEGTEPSLARVADILRVDREELIYALEAARTPKSLDDSLDEDKKIFLGDLLVSKQENSEIKILLNELLATLDKRSRYIVMQRFFAEKTQLELAAELQISQAQICRIEKKALNRLRHLMGED